MNTKDLIGKKVLITTSAWFVAPDGVEYRSVWGTLHNVIEAKEVLGFVPSRQHANWYVVVGNMVITGCQVNYCIECPNRPPEGRVKSWTNQNNTYAEYDRLSIVYFAE